MTAKPTYEELEQRVHELENEAFERKRTEIPLLESEAQKKAILDGITTNLAFVNENLEILWANKTAADSVNRTVDDMIGRKCHELWADPDSRCDDCPTAKAFKTKKTEQTIIHTPDGKVWEEKGEPVFDGKGRLIGVLEIAHDITARAKAEEALRESEKRLIEAQHIANMGDFTWDVETGEVTWSDGLFDLLQYDKSEGIDYARVNEEIHHPDDLERVTQWLNDCIASGKAELTPNEYRLVRKDGNILYVRTLGVIEREVGKPAKVFATIQDITERKQMEGEIRESEEKFRVLYNNSPDMSASVSPHDASILQCNETLLNKTGYSREEVIGSPIFKMYHNDCMAEVKKTFQEFVETGVIRARELTLKRKDGSKIDVSLNVNAIRGQAGEKIYSMSSWRDITERKQAELELIKAKHKAEEGEKRFRAFIAQSPVAIALFNLDGTGMYANQKYLDVLGLKSLGDFIGRPAHEYFAPQFREESKERSRRRLLGLPVPVEFESIALHSDGSEFPMQVAVGAIKLSAGETVNISFIANISDRKQAEEALRESEEKYKRLVENALVGVYQVEKEGAFITANQKMAEMFGYDSPKSLISSVDSIADLYARPEERPRILLDIDSKRFVYGKNVEFRKKDGENFWVKYFVRMFEDTGKIIYEGFMEDITENMRAEEERIKLEDQLQRAQKMEAIGTLAAGVAHDLNNILGGLVSYPELLLMQIPHDSPFRNSILTIQKSGEKAAAVVQDLLTLARRGVVVTDVINPNDVISEYLESPEHENLQSYHPGVHLETHLEKDVLNILGSSIHLSKTVMNLVSNAAEAMPQGGKLTVFTENRHIDRPIRGYDNVKEGDYVVLTISDTGTGISPDNIEKIFEPFYTKKKMGRSGTGLGMAVVWGTVKDHNGYIEVQSTEGKGTTFTLYFPVTRKELPEDKSYLTIGSYSGNGESILIVDDVEEQRKIASGMLKELGYSVVSVSSGEEAVEYLKTNKADLLLLDMIMDPGMDGLDTYKKILEIHPGQKAIIASGFSETDRVKEVQSLGAGPYIRKPLLLEKMGIAVKEELEKSAVFDVRSADA